MKATNNLFAFLKANFFHFLFNPSKERRVWKGCLPSYIDSCKT